LVLESLLFLAFVSLLTNESRSRSNLLVTIPTRAHSIPSSLFTSGCFVLE
jgi:hypothetical protein